MPSHYETHGIIYPTDFEFSAEFIKLNGQDEVIMNFEVNLAEVAPSYEEARTKALNKAQAIRRELADEECWYFKLDYEM